jgi:cell division protein FtsW (lipid II flippase)
MVFYQGFINLFGILGVIPLKGISVPFLSYGGSNIFYIITIFSFAIILLKINSEKTIYKL